MIFHILTIFPEFVEAFSNWSMVKRGEESGAYSLNIVNIRDFSDNKHKKVDDYPFGGGPGMLMTAEPIYKALDSVKTEGSKVIYMSPQGKTFTQEKAKELSKEKEIVILCGHYEGVDERIIENFVDEEISIGDYVLTGGEIPAFAVVESVIRLLPGVLSEKVNFKDESHFDGLLEHSQYTRPREWRGHKVPEILFSGDHKKIEDWKLFSSLKNTLLKRPELLESKDLTAEEKKILKELKDRLE